MEQFAIPGAGGIIEMVQNGVEHILVQERFKDDAPLERGLIEIPAGKIRAFENIYECLRREIREETGLTVTEILGEDKASYHDSNGYRVLYYEPFASSQNLMGIYPIMVQVFICKAAGDLVKMSNETKNLRWITIDELETLLNSESDFYPMHVTALKKYIKMKRGV